jgi:hypothetical protein
MSDAPTLSHMHPAELHGSPINPRTITDERFEALKYSLEHDPEMMDARPVIVTTGAEVVAGNMRLRASVEMLADPDEYPNFNAFVKRRGGLPTFIADLTETRKREWMLRDNQEYGDWEADALATVIREYDTLEDADRQLLGFSTQDMDRILGEYSDTGGGGEHGLHDVDAPDMWGIVVTCADEQSQGELLEELTDRGYDVRALL